MVVKSWMGSIIVTQGGAHSEAPAVPTCPLLPQSVSENHRSFAISGLNEHQQWSWRYHCPSCPHLAWDLGLLYCKPLYSSDAYTFDSYTPGPGNKIAS